MKRTRDSKWSSTIGRARAQWVLEFTEAPIESAADARRLAMEAGRLFGLAVDAGAMEWAQRITREGLDRLRQKGEWAWPVDYSLVALAPQRGVLRGPLMGRHVHRVREEEFIVAVMRALADAGERLRTCAKCKARAFVAATTQKHCKPCAASLQRGWVARWRKRNVERVRELNRRAYRRRRHEGRGREAGPRRRRK